MEKLVKTGLILVSIFSLILIMGKIETPSAQQYFTYVGKVVSIGGKFLSVQGSKGDIMNFAVGRKTIYIPAHLPAVGERVKVSYYFRKGNNVAYQVEVLPPPPPSPQPPVSGPPTSQPPPPAPVTTLTAPQTAPQTAPAPPEPEKKSIFGCARGCNPFKSKEGNK